MKLYLSNGARTDLIDNDRNSALHCATSNEYSDNDAKYNQSFGTYKDSIAVYHKIEDNNQIINILIDKGIDGHKDKIDVNVKNHHYHTPLFSAIEHRKFSNRKLLLQNGADTSVVDKNGLIAFHYAIKNKSLKILKLLLYAELKSEIKDILSKSSKKECLFSAIEEGIVDKVLPYIKKDSIINDIEDKESWSTIKRGISHVLIEKTKNSSDITNIIDKEGEHTFASCSKIGLWEEILCFLVKRGVDINAKNYNDVAPIHIAAKYGNLSQMKFFIENAAF